ncbi:MAG: putative DNA modification/repair radical SAM protein [Cellulosilyticaceae bacterium]
MNLTTKLEILSGAAKYDVSCSSSGSSRNSKKGQLGSTSSGGICHSFTPDGRCISLLKILLTNYCIYDCTYCINRKSNDISRAAFTVDEIVELTMNFYRRNYIEGLFLSSAVIISPDHTMELLTHVVSKLRLIHGFRGYIHVKAIPGASQELITTCGQYADRMSVNLELPSASSLKLLAPDKDPKEIFKPMSLIHAGIAEHHSLQKSFHNAPLFVPGGQSTQLIVGASPETDLSILSLSEKLYQKYDLKRVYYSAYVPVNTHQNLPSLISPPTLREHRLYQSDWLLRLYGFKANELLDEAEPSLDINFDPKTNWALRHMDHFPLEINTAPYEMLIRIPGIGMRGAKKIVSARRLASLTFEDLIKLRIVLKRAQYFILCKGKYHGSVDCEASHIRNVLMPIVDLNIIDQPSRQLDLFDHLSQRVPITDKTYLLSDAPSALNGEL